MTYSINTADLRGTFSQKTFREKRNPVLCLTSFTACQRIPVFNSLSDITPPEWCCQPHRSVQENNDLWRTKARGQGALQEEVACSGQKTELTINNHGEENDRQEGIEEQMKKAG